MEQLLLLIYTLLKNLQQLIHDTVRGDSEKKKFYSYHASK